ncbi:hypothetical protein D1872_227980 [compost metagenome]
MKFASAHPLHRLGQAPQIFENKGVQKISNDRQQGDQAYIRGDNLSFGLGNAVQGPFQRNHVHEARIDSLHGGYRDQIRFAVQLEPDLSLAGAQFSLKELADFLLKQLVTSGQILTGVQIQFSVPVHEQHLGFII